MVLKTENSISYCPYINSDCAQYWLLNLKIVIMEPEKVQMRVIKMIKARAGAISLWVKIVIRALLI